MQYIIYNGKIKAVINIIKYKYNTENNQLNKEQITGERYILFGEDYNEILKEMEKELVKPENKDVEITVEDIDSSDITDYDGLEASNYDEAERIIKNMTLEEQLIETQFEIDKMKLFNDINSLLP